MQYSIYLVNTRSIETDRVTKLKASEFFPTLCNIRLDPLEQDYFRRLKEYNLYNYSQLDIQVKVIFDENWKQYLKANLSTGVPFSEIIIMQVLLYNCDLDDYMPANGYPWWYVYRAYIQESWLCIVYIHESGFIKCLRFKYDNYKSQKIIYYHYNDDIRAYGLWTVKEFNPYLQLAEGFIPHTIKNTILRTEDDQESQVMSHHCVQSGGKFTLTKLAPRSKLHSQVPFYNDLQTSYRERLKADDNFRVLLKTKREFLKDCRVLDEVCNNQEGSTDQKFLEFKATVHTLDSQVKEKQRIIHETQAKRNVPNVKGHGDKAEVDYAGMLQQIKNLKSNIEGCFISVKEQMTKAKSHLDCAVRGIAGINHNLSTTEFIAYCDSGKKLNFLKAGIIDALKKSANEYLQVLLKDKEKDYVPMFNEKFCVPITGTRVLDSEDYKRFKLDGSTDTIYAFVEAKERELKFEDKVDWHNLPLSQIIKLVNIILARSVSSMRAPRQMLRSISSRVGNRSMQILNTNLKKFFKGNKIHLASCFQLTEEDLLLEQTTITTMTDNQHRFNKSIEMYSKSVGEQASYTSEFEQISGFVAQKIIIFEEQINRMQIMVEEFCSNLALIVCHVNMLHAEWQKQQIDRGVNTTDLRMNEDALRFCYIGSPLPENYKDQHGYFEAQADLAYLDIRSLILRYCPNYTSIQKALNDKKDQYIKDCRGTICLHRESKSSIIKLFQLGCYTKSSYYDGVTRAIASHVQSRYSDDYSRIQRDDNTLCFLLIYYLFNALGQVIGRFLIGNLNTLDVKRCAIDRFLKEIFVPNDITRSTALAQTAYEYADQIFLQYIGVPSRIEAPHSVSPRPIEMPLKQPGFASTEKDQKPFYQPKGMSMQNPKPSREMDGTITSEASQCLPLGLAPATTPLPSLRAQQQTQSSSHDVAIQPLRPRKKIFTQRIARAAISRPVEMLESQEIDVLYYALCEGDMMNDYFEGCDYSFSSGNPEVGINNGCKVYYLSPINLTGGTTQTIFHHFYEIFRISGHASFSETLVINIPIVHGVEARGMRNHLSRQPHGSHFTALTIIFTELDQQACQAELAKWQSYTNGTQFQNALTMADQNDWLQVASNNGVDIDDQAAITQFLFEQNLRRPLKEEYLTRLTFPRLYQNITLYHADSLSGNYGQNVERIIGKHIQEKFGNYKFIPCNVEKQIGMTCGDHTVVNLLSLSGCLRQGLSVTVPLGAKNSIGALDIRNLTCREILPDPSSEDQVDTDEWLRRITSDPRAASIPNKWDGKCGLGQYWQKYEPFMLEVWKNNALPSDRKIIFFSVSIVSLKLWFIFETISKAKLSDKWGNGVAVKDLEREMNWDQIPKSDRFYGDLFPIKSSWPYCICSSVTYAKLTHRLDMHTTFTVSNLDKYSYDFLQRRRAIYQVSHSNQQLPQMKTVTNDSGIFYKHLHSDRIVWDNTTLRYIHEILETTRPLDFAAREYICDSNYGVENLVVQLVNIQKRINSKMPQLIPGFIAKVEEKLQGVNDEFSRLFDEPARSEGGVDINDIIDNALEAIFNDERHTQNQQTGDKYKPNIAKEFLKAAIQIELLVKRIKPQESCSKSLKERIQQFFQTFIQ